MADKVLPQRVSITQTASPRKSIIPGLLLCWTDYKCLFIYILIEVALFKVLTSVFL